jgi:uncharacterized protein YciI
MRLAVSIPALLSLALVAAPVRTDEKPREDAAPPATTSAPEPATMTTYVVGFLVRGPRWSTGSKPELEKLQEEHLAHVRMMAEVGKLIVAGPFPDGGRIRGMSIFRAVSVDEVKVLAEADPAVVSGRLRYEWHPWYSMKGIGVCPIPAPDKE